MKTRPVSSIKGEPNKACNFSQYFANSHPKNNLFSILEKKKKTEILYALFHFVRAVEPAAQVARRIDKTFSIVIPSFREKYRWQTDDDRFADERTMAISNFVSTVKVIVRKKNKKIKFKQDN